MSQQCHADIMYDHEPGIRSCSLTIHSYCILCTMSCRYDLMMKCWNKSPARRPRFSELVSVISTSLEGMADYMELSTEPLSKDLTVTTGEECVEQRSDVEHVLDHETEETECRNNEKH